MSNVIDLQQYRKQRKRQYIKSHEHQLERFFEAFVSRHFKETYPLLSDQYMACKVSQNEMAWDYHDFRDALKEAIAIVYGAQIWQELRTQSWFDPKHLSAEEVIDRCTSFFILRATFAANQ